MKPDDSSSYDSNNNWKLGTEIWCNKQGRYIDVSFVMDSFADGATFEMSICTLGIMGTKYVLKEGEIMPTTISVEHLDTKVVSIPLVESKFEIGDILDI